MKKALEVKDNIYWTGALDYDIRTFDIVMHTDYGTTYNSYVIKGEKHTALIEAAKDRFFSEHIERIKSITAPEEIDYLIVNHTEPDHTGAIEQFLNINPDITLVGSAAAIKFLKEITNKAFNSMIVKDGDILNLGGSCNLRFISAPFLHWPDSMYTYAEESRVLFTCDSFGCHYCSEAVFNDKIEDEFLDAYKYYFDCIMGPFKEHVKKALTHISGIDIDVICPGHGPVLRENTDKYIGLYDKWSEKIIENKIIICYVSAYGYTKAIAESISDGILENGKYEVKMYDLESSNLNDVISELQTAKGLLIGSPTIVNDTLPPVWALLGSLNPTINKGLYAGAFGSYGWSGEAITNIEGRLKQLKFTLPLEPLKIMFNPSPAQHKLAHDFGCSFASSLT